MTDEQINAAIAKACGWIDIIEHPEFGLMGVNLKTHGYRTGIEDYCNDLNAMHEAEKVLKGYEQIATYVWHLENRSGDWSTDEHMMATHATARQRAEAFLRTLGKWVEAK
jgi:hypothetical protein